MVLLGFNDISCLLAIMALLIGFCENICLQVAELQSTFDIIVEVNETITVGFDWIRPSDDLDVLTCSVNDRCVKSRPRYDGKMAGKRTSILTINSVQKIDTGLWQLGAERSRYNVCRLTTARNPNCSIHSDRDPDGIDLGEKLTLTATFKGYYCSGLAAFSLTTGNVTEMLQNNHTQDNATDEDLNTVFSHTVNINLTRFGDITLNFICDSRTWTQTCDGVNKIIKSMPLCKISSNRDADDLDLGDELTLTVDIRGYYCPKLVGFTLTTGKVKDMLLENHNVRDVTDAIFNKTISMRVTRFGDVEVHYTCDGDTRKLGCGGVMELVQTMPLCKISSNRDADDLDLGDELTLTVDIRGYYCPKLVGFTLTTGKVKDMLLENHNVRDVTDAIFNKTISMRVTRFGDVEVHYTCDGDTRKLGCGGVMELVRNGTSNSPRPVSPFPDPGLPITIIVGAVVVALLIIILIVVIIVNRGKLQRKAQKYIVDRKKTRNAPNMEGEIPTGNVK